jgi:hypothetical protein
MMATYSYRRVVTTTCQTYKLSDAGARCDSIPIVQERGSIWRR